MEKLFAKQDRLLQLQQTKLVRHQMEEINWNARLIAIRGARGVGKSTIMLQYIKTHYPQYSRNVMYCTLDSMYFSTNSLLELADMFYKYGGRHLFLDEVHKYANWSREIKEIYDMYPDMRVVISGSSLLNLLTGDADLSRRAVPYQMQGLSFREYLSFYHGISINPVNLEDLLDNPGALCSEVNEKCSPLPLFKDYLRNGYYPFYLDNSIDYYTTMEQIVAYVIENELPQLCRIDTHNTRKLKALTDVLAQNVPFEVDISKLASAIGVHRNTVIDYLLHLSNARILNLLFSDILSVKKMQKPDKIFLENPNLLYALATNEVKIGTARETFVVNQLSHSHTIEYSKSAGDFRIDGKYTFEVGGQSKTFAQIADLPNSYVLADDIDTPIGKKLPIWTVGFLY